MTKDDMEIVSAVQVALADKVGSERFELVGANTRLSLSDHALTVSVPNAFFQEWLRNNFRRELEASCLEALGTSLPITFRKIHARLNSASRKNRPPGRPARLAEPSRRPLVNRPSPLAPLQVVGGTVQPSRSSAARRLARLDSFVVGAANRLAYVAAKAAGATGRRFAVDCPRPHRRWQNASAGGGLVDGKESQSVVARRLSLGGAIHDVFSRGFTRLRTAKLSQQVPWR